MVFAVAGASAQGPEPGISRALAVQRAEALANVRYELEFWLEEGAEEVRGQALVYFTLPEGTLPEAPVILDFDGAGLSDLRVNGVPEQADRVHNHLVISPEHLDPGRNRIGASFRSRVASTGTPLTVFRDAARQEEFWYTLVVPADAHRLFPCFDQPDLKAVFAVKLHVPGEWVAVANGAQKSAPQATPDGDLLYEFEDTVPLSTYLMAFAAGPFEILNASIAGTKQARLFLRKNKIDQVDQPALVSMHDRSLRWLAEYFDFEYPFGKLDIVLVPGFPYGGMEHAGAIFYREAALVFDHTPTESELVRRSTLIYHEVCHQWFGNLVTMEWFDDLWLKEGFATFLGYHLLDALEPERTAWLRFHQRVKPNAYRIDATPGTTPVYQELGNLADAKSAYGAIVYNKAPAVLRELHERIGATAFRDGVRLFLDQHQYSNAQWQDLVASLEQASGRDLAKWSESWILTAGMPRVRAHWASNETASISEFELHQEGIQDPDATWPLVVSLSLSYPDGRTESHRVETSETSTTLSELVGSTPPAAVLLNAQDHAYGQFLLDAKSRQHLLKHLPAETDPVRRAVALTALFDTVREAELEPVSFARLLLRILNDERDPLTQRWLLDTLGSTLRRYVDDEDRRELTSQAVGILAEQLAAGLPGLELQTFRFVARTADPVALDLCERLLAEPDAIPGLQLGVQDRYLALAALHAAGRAEPWLEKMTGDATPPDAEKHAFLALAAGPDRANKDAYFEAYLHPDDPPEQWMQESLSFFHWAGQHDVTLPFLRRSLDQVEWVKANRKIFYMPAWIDAFVNGHSDRRALDIVQDFLAERTDLPVDIRRKILQSLDGLQRAVAIKERWE